MVVSLFTPEEEKANQKAMLRARAIKCSSSGELW